MVNLMGIEIGGTKIQVGVRAAGETQLIHLERFEVDRGATARTILDRLSCVGRDLIHKYEVRQVGVAFGGPVDRKAGRAVTSHQVAGWDAFDWRGWAADHWGCHLSLVNDCDAAALAEARLGAGRHSHSTFYVTIGTGIGGGFVSAGQLVGQQRPAIAELGHLRPGPQAQDPGDTVESIASGRGIEQQVLARIQGSIHSIESFQRPSIGSHAPNRSAVTANESYQVGIDDLQQRCHGDWNQLSAKLIGQAAQAGNRLAEQVLENACRTLGWAVAQMITLLAPETIVLGGGVSLLGESLFLAPVRQHTAHFVFPPLKGSYEIVAAELGEEVVVHGALLIAEADPGRVGSD